MKILRVGDPHAKVGSLAELRTLILFVVQQAQLHNVQRIEILGDLFHTHNVIRLEVIEFWTWALDLLSKLYETVVLVGNHDQSGDYHSNFSALSLFALVKWKNLYIIEKPTLIGVYAYIPYTHSPNDFIIDANRLASEGGKVLVCHQTIEGSKYESGIYAPDGIPSEGWHDRFIHVISGHIHSEQAFANIIYPGTARWDTVSDANQPKGIWVFSHDYDGKILSSERLSTETVCSPIKTVEWREGETAPEPWTSTVRMNLSLIGSSAWIAEQKDKYKGKCSISTKITDAKKTVIRKTGKSFEDYLKNHYTSTVDRERLLDYARELKIV
jgi:DNA repair exonuclease SbcCD nuclease subunit